MKIKLSSIVESTESLKAIQEVKLPVKIAYRIKRLIDKLSPILQAYEEKRAALVKEMGEEKEGGTMQVKAENIKPFLEKIQDLQTVEEEVEWEPIKISELGETTLQAKDIIDFIFCE